MNSGNNPTLDQQDHVTCRHSAEVPSDHVTAYPRGDAIIFPGRMGPNSERDPALDTQAGI